MFSTFGTTLENVLLKREHYFQFVNISVKQQYIFNLENFIKYNCFFKISNKFGKDYHFMNFEQLLER